MNVRVNPLFNSVFFYLCLAGYLPCLSCSNWVLFRLKKSDRVKPVLITVNDVCRLGWSFSICHEVSWLQWTLSSLQWMLRYWQVKWKSRLLIIVNIPSDAARFGCSQPNSFPSFTDYSECFTDYSESPLTRKPAHDETWPDSGHWPAGQDLLSILITVNALTMLGLVEVDWVV